MMLHKNGISSYHKTDSLLVQFVLYEFLVTLEEAAAIKKCTETADTHQDYFDKITLYLLKLAGSEKEYMRIFSWILDSGVLTKLKNYSDLLSERANKTDPDFIRLHNAAHKAWLDCLHAVDFIRENTPNQDPVESLKGVVEKALNSIKKLVPVIRKIIPKYAEDENVLYFILRHQSRLDRSLGKGWTQKLLAKLQPEGLLKKLKEAFEKRGFDHLIPSIRHNLEYLNRESSA